MRMAIVDDERIYSISRDRISQRLRVHLHFRRLSQPLRSIMRVFAGRLVMQELNPLFAKIKDLQARGAALRGYL